MALSPGYVARETWTNLRRNLLMTVAAVVTMSVALLVGGSALLWRQGVNKQTTQWRGGIELAIFMQPTATDTQLQAVNAELDALPEVKKLSSLNKAQAFEEMKQLFANQPEILQSLGVQDAPPSFRVVPYKPEQVEDIGERFKDKPGVLEVVYAKKTIDILLKSTATKSNIARVLAVASLLAATLIILNTVRMAIFSRRREVAVMKLVGATNWFIRVPFMLEGMVQGLLGALGASIVMFIFKDQIMSLVNDAAISQFTSLYATTSETLITAFVLLLVGGFVGGASSAVAVRSYLDV